jgi:short-subunit dehydrogenase
MSLKLWSTAFDDCSISFEQKQIEYSSEAYESGSMHLNKGDVAIITGASRGLGVFIAREFAKKGMSLVLAARSEPGLKKVADELKSLGVDILTLPTDVADPNALQTLVDASVQRFGRIDVLVNNAGFAYTLPYDQVDAADIQHIVAVNLTAPMLLTRLVMPIMFAARRGHIVNIASLAGVLPTPYEELYTATKHGLVGFTRSLRASIQDNRWPIGASLICPGFMDDAGIYEDYKQKFGVKAPSAIGSMSASQLGQKVIRAIEENVPDVFVTKGPVRFSSALLALAPRFFESFSARMNTAAIFRSIAAGHVKARAEKKSTR